jgi:glutathione S-transferase
MDNNLPKLTYFAARGTCDQIRLLLAETNIPYYEMTINGLEFNKIKNFLPFQQLPLWEENNLKIVHANAIMRHLARKTEGLYGNNEEERSLCDMWEEQCDLILKNFWQAEFMKNNIYSDFKLNEMKHKYFYESLSLELKNISNLMSLNNNYYLVGEKLTFVDIKLFSVLDAINKEIKIAIPSFPLLENFYQEIGKRHRILEFCLSDKRF